MFVAAENVLLSHRHRYGGSDVAAAAPPGTSPVHGPLCLILWTIVPY
jgi:hypothetical protein